MYTTESEEGRMPDGHPPGNPAPLYDRWRHVAREYRHERALRDATTGQHWTFGELLASSDNRTASPAGPVHPQGHSLDFILTVLRGWRDGRVVCPLEPGQHFPKLPLPPSRIVHLKLTSATTGAPRVVAFTEAQLAADARNIVTTMGLRPDWPNLAAISLAHSYGFSNLVLPLLLHGIPLILVASPLPEAVRRAAAGEPDLTLPGVPALWRSWHEARAIPANARLAISAGAPLPVALEQSVFAATGLKTHNFYGSSECGGIAFDRSTAPRTEEGLTGSALDHVSLTIGPDRCLVVRGTNIAETYWPEPSLALGAGCFRTGDLAEIEGGRVFLRGRVSDVINVAGRKVDPCGIEQVLVTHPAVRECLVLGWSAAERERGDVIAAVVVLQEPVTVEALRQFLLLRLPAWQVPRDWRFADSLGPNARGKISRAEWRLRFAAAGSAS